MAHSHGHCCEHEHMAYCKVCRVAYCKDCGKEWHEYVWYCGTYYQSPYTITYGTSAGDTAAAPVDVTPRITCAHGHAGGER